MMARLSCLVPHCRRTTRADNPIVEWPDTGWICGDHWRGVPRRMKAVKRRARRALRSSDDTVGLNMIRFMRISARCTRCAVERAVGIS